MNYSKGITWFDDCRIPFVDTEGINLDKELGKQEGGTIYGGGKGFYRTENLKEYKPEGRYPPNLLVCDDMLNDGNKGTNSRYYDIDLWFNNLLENYIY